MGFSYTKIGDSIVDLCTVIIAIHLSSASVVEPLVLKTPPAVRPTPIASYLWEPFNRLEQSLCFGRDDNNFNKDKATLMIVSVPKQAKLGSITPIMILYHLHRADEDATILAGSGILSPLSLCLPCEACPTRNLFQHFFGIEFHFDGNTYVRMISTLSLLVALTSLKTFSTASLMKNTVLGWTL
jgi:hypothetical protein